MDNQDSGQSRDSVPAEIHNACDAQRDLSAREPALRLVVAIPTTNRAEIVPDTVRAIASQDRLPELVILSLAHLDDLGELDAEDLPFPLKVLIGPKGATAQRNRILRELQTQDIVVLLDDDFLMAPDYLRRTLEVFAADPAVVLLTGTVLADGVHGPGYTHEQGLKLLNELNVGDLSQSVTTIHSGYGCNFAIRNAVACKHGLLFDEKLPLYSWLEDVDYSRRIAPYGKIVKSGAARGVHLATKMGRTPGLLFGYSQIANPIYLHRKGSISLRHALTSISRNAASNILHSLRPPAWADFRGRLRGNVLAVYDLIKGRSSPGRILEIKV